MTTTTSDKAPGVRCQWCETETPADERTYVEGGEVCPVCGCGAEMLEEMPADEEERLLCGECSDDMGVVFDEWPSALDDLPASDRIPCSKCGG
jgi:ribosomal protein S27AE